MANKKTEPVTAEQMKEIIETIRNGFSGTRPNDAVASALVLEGNLGLRISDILKLRLKDIKLYDGRYRLDIVERKTGKSRNFILNKEIYYFLLQYCRNHNIPDEAVIFGNISERWVQMVLRRACEYLGYDVSVIGTHSFRKFFATSIYYENSKDIRLVQTVLQHSSASISARYINVSSQQIEDALTKHVHIV